MVPKLYMAPRFTGAWIAYSDDFGWVSFPAKEGGWEQRTPYLGTLDDLTEISTCRAFNTGFPGAPVGRPACVETSPR